MRSLKLAVLGALLLSSGVASAHPRAHVRVVVPAPAVRVVVDPWGPAYVPAPRDGWVWIAGHYEGRRFVPGHWEPVARRAGWVWVPGHWDGPVYIEGTWRPEVRPGYAWVEGFYDEAGRWHDGYWSPAGAAPPPEPPPPSTEAPPPPDAPAAPAPSEPETVHHDYE